MNILKYFSQCFEPQRAMYGDTQSRPEFEKKYLVPLQVIGGGGGDFFSLSDIESGATLEKIRVWAGDCQIRCIKVWLTNGKNQMFGFESGKYSEYTFSPGERIVSLSLWDNAMKGTEQRLGAIKFETTNRGSFFSEMTHYNPGQEKPIDVGSGVCVGVTGHHGWHIDSFGLVFIHSIESCVLSNITYTTIDDFMPHVTVEEIKSMIYRNSTSVTQEFTLQTTKKVTEKSSWSVSEKKDFAFNLTVKGTIPHLVEGGTGFSLAVGRVGVYSVEHSEEKDETVSVPIKVPTQKAMSANVNIGRAVLDLPYKGDMKITCNNGSALKFKISGIYNGVTYTSAELHVIESEIES